jgi:hypothetical protein
MFAHVAVESVHARVALCTVTTLVLAVVTLRRRTAEVITSLAGMAGSVNASNARVRPVPVLLAVERTVVAEALFCAIEASLIHVSPLLFTVYVPAVAAVSGIASTARKRPSTAERRPRSFSDLTDGRARALAGSAGRT